eukprot:3475602-Rhodomonas_salina.1
MLLEGGKEEEGGQGGRGAVGGAGRTEGLQARRVRGVCGGRVEGGRDGGKLGVRGCSQRRVLLSPRGVASLSRERAVPWAPRRARPGCSAGCAGASGREEPPAERCRLRRRAPRGVLCLACTCSGSRTAVTLAGAP